MKSPFKKHSEFKKEINSFLKRSRTTLGNHAKRTSDYFEMSCFNLIVKFYRNSGYSVKIKNLNDDGEYYYKCSPAGLQENYSYFEVIKKVGKRNFSFEIQHNLAVQSCFDKEVFTNPDIVVIKIGSSQTTIGHYDSKKRFSFVENKSMITFFECKNFNPFPELIFNFMGVVNELRNDILTNSASAKRPIHLAPTLMISGKPSKPTNRIKDSLEGRYQINVLFDLFYDGSKIFWESRQSELRTTGKITVNPYPF